MNAWSLDEEGGGRNLSRNDPSSHIEGFPGEHGRVVGVGGGGYGSREASAFSRDPPRDAGHGVGDPRRARERGRAGGGGGRGGGARGAASSGGGNEGDESISGKARRNNGSGRAMDPRDAGRRGAASGKFAVVVDRRKEAAAAAATVASAASPSLLLASSSTLGSARTSSAEGRDGGKQRRPAGDYLQPENGGREVGGGGAVGDVAGRNKGLTGGGGGGGSRERPSTHGRAVLEEKGEQRGAERPERWGLLEYRARRGGTDGDGGAPAEVERRGAERWDLPEYSAGRDTSDGAGGGGKQAASLSPRSGGGDGVGANAAAAVMGVSASGLVPRSNGDVRDRRGGAELSRREDGVGKRAGAGDGEGAEGGRGKADGGEERRLEGSGVARRVLTGGSGRDEGRGGRSLGEGVDGDGGHGFIRRGGDGEMDGIDSGRAGRRHAYGDVGSSRSRSRERPGVGSDGGRAGGRDRGGAGGSDRGDTGGRDEVDPEWKKWTSSYAARVRSDAEAGRQRRQGRVRDVESRIGRGAGDGIRRPREECQGRQPAARPVQDSLRSSRSSDQDVVGDAGRRSRGDQYLEPSQQEPRDREQSTTVTPRARGLTDDTSSHQGSSGGSGNQWPLPTDPPKDRPQRRSQEQPPVRYLRRSADRAARDVEGAPRRRVEVDSDASGRTTTQRNPIRDRSKDGCSDRDRSARARSAVVRTPDDSTDASARDRSAGRSSDHSTDTSTQDRYANRTRERSAGMSTRYPYAGRNRERSADHSLNRSKAHTHHRDDDRCRSAGRTTGGGGSGGRDVGIRGRTDSGRDNDRDRVAGRRDGGESRKRKNDDLSRRTEKHGRSDRDSEERYRQSGGGGGGRREGEARNASHGYHFTKKEADGDGDDQRYGKRARAATDDGVDTGRGDRAYGQKVAPLLSGAGGPQEGRRAGQTAATAGEDRRGQLVWKEQETGAKMGGDARMQEDGVQRQKGEGSVDVAGDGWWQDFGARGQETGGVNTAGQKRGELGASNDCGGGPARGKGGNKSRATAVSRLRDAGKLADGDQFLSSSDSDDEEMRSSSFRDKRRVLSSGGPGDGESVSEKSQLPSHMLGRAPDFRAKGGGKTHGKENDWIGWFVNVINLYPIGLRVPLVCQKKAL